MPPRPTLRRYQLDDITKIARAPFRDADEASRWIGQRALWWQGLGQHMAMLGAHPPPYPEFVFDESVPRGGIEYLVDMQEPTNRPA